MFASLAAVYYFGVCLLFFAIAAWGSCAAVAWIGSTGLQKNVREFAASLALFAIANVPILAAETFMPAVRVRQKRVRAAAFWVLFLAVGYAWSLLCAPFLATLWPLVIYHTLWAAVAWFVLFDFLHYWFHRAQHRYAFLWRFHRVHHSIHDLSALNSYSHPFEHVLRLPFIVLPISLILRVDAVGMMGIYAAATAWQQYLHSATRVNFGAARVLLADNVQHREHHSIESGDANFAAFFPLIDVLFGTYRAPTAGGFSAVGLKDQREPATMRDYLLQPLLRE